MIQRLIFERDFIIVIKCGGKDNNYNNYNIY